VSTPNFRSSDPDDVGDSAEQPPLTGLIDRDLVEKIMSQALIDGGYVKEEEGLVLADDKPLKAAVVQTMLDNHVVNSGKEMPSRGVTKFELYAELLPTAPGITSLPESVEENEAKTKLMNKVWGYVNTGTTGHVQQNISDSGYVVVEAQVRRTKVHQETGKKEISTEMARFLTADRELIMTHLTGPAGSKFVAQARRLENLLGMVTERRPELAVPVARQLNVVVKQAVAAIPHADARQAAALTSGNRDGDGATA
jgi:hypothetical protein